MSIMAEQAPISTIIKRDGKQVSFETDRITQAIYKSMKALGYDDAAESERLMKRCVEHLNETHKDKTPTVEEVQDTVEAILIKEGKPEVAKAFILYRQQRAQLRKTKQGLLGGLVDDSKVSLNGLLLAKERYLLKDSEGITRETPKMMFLRVAKAIAQTEKIHKTGQNEIQELEKNYFDLLSRMQFVPGGRILSGAGTPQNYLLSSFVIPLKDSMRGIFSALLEKAMIQRLGGGTGFSFSRLRGKATPILQSGAVASGPVAFIALFNHASSLTVQKGNRLGANMASLSVEHPDIVEFISAKDRLGLSNFNLSVEVTDAFMEAVEANKSSMLKDPHTGGVVKEPKAKQIFDIMVFMAWKTGDPGLLFIDRINKDNATPTLGRIETTDPCGDSPMLGYDSSPIGAINLSLFVSPNGTIEWKKLKPAVHLGVRFLDSVIDATKFPLPIIEKTVASHRRIGLGVMGFADMLFQMDIPYNSEKGIEVADKVMKFIKDEAEQATLELGKTKGNFPLIKDSIHKSPRRNAGLLAIAPSGSRSILCETSAGIEPHFALGYRRKIFGNTDITYVNPFFESELKKAGLFTDDLHQHIAGGQSIQGMEQMPERIRQVYVTAHDIRPRWHIRMQATFQKHIDGAISKTINFPEDATLKDVDNAFVLAWKSGCKGLTIYRDKSHIQQVINI